MTLVLAKVDLDMYLLDFLMMFVDFFFFMLFCTLVLINLAIKGQRYQHVLALCAIVRKGNIENTNWF